MSTYLQRLLDRVAPTLPSASVQPAGISHSPVNLSDQRLNQDFTEHSTPVTNSHEPLADTSPSPVHPAPQQTPQQPIAKAEQSEATTLPDLAPTQITETVPETLVTETQQPMTEPQYPRPVGFVDSADLVLPDPEPALENNQAVPAPTLPKQPEPLVLQTEPAKLTSEPMAQPEPTKPSIPLTQKNSVPTHTPVEFAEAAPLPPQPRAESIPAAPAPDLASQEQPASALPKVEPPATVEALPPRINVPPLPELPVSAPRQQKPKLPPEAKAKTEQVPPIQSPSVDTRHNRPMTAASASIIGQLSSRRRALSIFGLRRR